MLKKVGGGAGDTRDTVALKAEVQRLEQIVAKQEKIIGDYERIWSDVSSGISDGGGGEGNGAGNSSVGAIAVVGNVGSSGSNGAARLRALMLSYRKEKEQINAHFDDLKARYQRFASDVDTERDNHKAQLEQLRSSAAGMEQMNKHTESLQAERNRLRVELDTKSDEADTKTKELIYVKGIYQHTL